MSSQNELNFEGIERLLAAPLGAAAARMIEVPSGTVMSIRTS